MWHRTALKNLIARNSNNFFRLQKNLLPQAGGFFIPEVSNRMVPDNGRFVLTSNFRFLTSYLRSLLNHFIFKLLLIAKATQTFYRKLRKEVRNQRSEIGKLPITDSSF